MAHEIENEQIAYRGETPWHGIGASMGDDATPEDFMRAANLDWQVNPAPLFVKHEDGTFTQAKGKTAFVRSSDKKIMTYASDRWKPVQNITAIGFMKRYVEAGGAKMETVGALRDGQIIWALARINRSFEVRPGDKVNGYMLITSPHQVGTSTRISTTTVRVVCANTMRMADSASTTWYSQNHLSDFDESSARSAVAQASDALSSAETRAKTMDGLKLSIEDAVRKVLVPVFAPDLLDEPMIMDEIMNFGLMPNRIQEIVMSIKRAPGAIEDTGWGVMNGVTHWCDHVGGRTPETRMFRSWIGDYSRLKIETEKKIMELV